MRVVVIFEGAKNSGQFTGLVMRSERSEDKNAVFLRTLRIRQGQF